MSISRFDDREYGKLITSRVLNAYGGEYTYFTPTRAAADLGGQLDVPTLNLIGTRDEFFGPPAHDSGPRAWEGSIASQIAADATTGWGDADLTGNAYASYLRQGVRRGLVPPRGREPGTPCCIHAWARTRQGLERGTPCCAPLMSYVLYELTSPASGPLHG